MGWFRYICISNIYNCIIIGRWMFKLCCQIVNDLVCRLVLYIVTIWLSPLHIACREGITYFVKWMVSLSNTRNCDINLYKENCTVNYPPIIRAIEAGNFECIRAICSTYGGCVEIIKHNGLIRATECGNIRVLPLLLSTLIQRAEVTNFNELMNECSFLSIESLNKLIFQANKSESLGASRLLTNIRDKCILTKNFGLLLAFLNYESSDISKQNIINKHIEMRKDTKIAQKLIEYIKQDTYSDLILTGLNTAINKMIKNKEIINDSLLFMANIIDQKSLNTNLENGLKDILSRDINTPIKTTTAASVAATSIDEKTDDDGIVSFRSISDLFAEHDNTRADAIETIKLEEITSESLESEVNLRDDSWYKSNLLDSNIWCIHSKNIGQHGVSLNFENSFYHQAIDNVLNNELDSLRNYFKKCNK